MDPLTRRSLLGLGLTAAATASLRPVRLLAGQQTDNQAAIAVADKPYEFGLEVLGQVKPVPSRDIAASPLSVGFEVLDRQLFDPEKTYPHLAELGVKWARCQTGWCRCETVPGQYDFDWLDKVVDSLRKIGVQPWFNLGYGNKLYTPEADATAVGWVPLFDPKARDAWLRFVRALAEHFSDRVQCWEIWNEPNLSTFWKPRKPAAADYVELVKLTAPEIRRRVPRSVIVGGALAGMPADFARQCFEAGMGEWIDKLTFHPYRPVPESGYEKGLDELRGILRRHNAKIGLWQGENGCPSVSGGSGALSSVEWNEWRQAKWLLRRVLSDLRLGVELSSYFHLVDLVAYGGKTNPKGLLRGTDYSPKPAFYAYQCLAALFDAATTRGDAAPEWLDIELPKEKHPYLRSGSFARRGLPLVAYWYPATLQDGWTAASLGMKLSGKAAKLRDPVLIDPLSRQVFRIAKADGKDENLVLSNLPLLDYPLLVTDRAVALS